MPRPRLGISRLVLKKKSSRASATEKLAIGAGQDFPKLAHPQVEGIGELDGIIPSDVTEVIFVFNPHIENVMLVVFE